MVVFSEGPTWTLLFSYNICVICDICGKEMKYRSTTKRIVKFPGGEKREIQIRVLTCCGKYKRELPDYLVPFKHYTKETIEKVKSGEVSEKDILYEDFPCEMTMKRWKKS